MNENDEKLLVKKLKEMDTPQTNRDKITLKVDKELQQEMIKNFNEKFKVIKLVEEKPHEEKFGEKTDDEPKEVKVTQEISAKSKSVWKKYKTVMQFV